MGICCPDSQMLSRQQLHTEALAQSRVHTMCLVPGTFGVLAHDWMCRQQTCGKPASRQGQQHAQRCAHHCSKQIQS